MWLRNHIRKSCSHRSALHWVTMSCFSFFFLNLNVNFQNNSIYFSILKCNHSKVPDYILKIRVGSNQWNSDGQLFSVQRQLAHPKYIPHEVHHDIGLVTLQSPIQFNSKVRAIGYARTEPSPGTQLLATRSECYMRYISTA